MLALRQIVMPDTPIAEYEFSAAVVAFRAGRISDNEFHWMLRFYSFAASAHDPLTHVLDARRVFAEISGKHAEGALSDAEHDFLMTRCSEVRHTVYACAEQRRLLEPLGSCEVVPPGRSCSRDLFGIFVVDVR
jgi:hypothetical protein